MLSFLTLIASLALVYCQTHHPHPTHTPHPHPTHETHTPHPHLNTHETHTPHPHPTHETHTPHQNLNTHETHTPHPHPTHAPQVDGHVFVDQNVVFMKDLSKPAIILKSDSGCYVTHLTQEEVKHIEDLEKLLTMESHILHKVRDAKHFTMAINPTTYSADVQSACPKLYAYHKEHQA